MNTEEPNPHIMITYAIRTGIRQGLWDFAGMMLVCFAIYTCIGYLYGVINPKPPTTATMKGCTRENI